MKPKGSPGAGEHPLGTSYFEARKRFSRAQKSLEYPSEYQADHRHDEREKNTILRLLDHIPEGSSILDLPCGSGRLTRLLVQRGYRVRCADVSSGMLERARANYERYRTQLTNQTGFPPIEFDLEDIMQTRYADHQFDAVICNRLFHHFTESQTRVTALKELRRICSGTLIISFFNSKSLDAYWRRVRNFIRGKIPTDRVPIPMELFKSELNQVGFQLIETGYIWRHISPLCYVVVRPQD